MKKFLNICLLLVICTLIGCSPTYPTDDVTGEEIKTGPIYSMSLS